jgi:hypothetical protein
VRTVPAWGEQKAAGGVAGRATPVRPVRHTGQTGADLGRQGTSFRARDGSQVGSGDRGFGGWSGEFAGGQIARRSPLVPNTGMGGVVALRWRRGTVHCFPFVVLVLLKLERVGSIVVVTMVVFVEVALVGEILWIVLIPLWSKWLGTGFTLLVLTPMMSRLFTQCSFLNFR